MKAEGLIFLIIGIAICLLGLVYTVDWALVGAWMGGFLMILISVVVMFPQRRGMGIE